MRTANIGIRPLTPHLGAVVDGIDLSQPLSEGQLGEIRRAFVDWSVLVFRDQRIDREQHKAFGSYFGKLHVHPLKAAAGYEGGEDPAVLVVKTTANSKFTAGEGWHTDVTCDAEPPMGSMLYITQVPPHGGGDTLFANMYRAYDSLSVSMQTYLEELTAVHDGARPYMGNYGYQLPPGQTFPKNEHPVVIRHPETGKKVLFVNSGFTSHIKGLKRFESQALLDMLFEHIATTPSLTCRVGWEPGTLTFWDNRCTQHHSVWDYYPETRYGERVSIIGERPSL